jgi:hypothetical protein
MKFKAIALMFILLTAYGLEAWGQTTSNGMFGSRTMGTSTSAITPSFGGTSSMGGMGGMSGSGMGMNGMGMSGMGGMGTSGMGMSGMSGMETSMGNTQSGQFIGANTGQTGFIGGGQLGQNQGGRMTTQNYGMNSGQYGQFGNTRGNQANRGNQQYGQGGYGSQNNRNQVQMSIARHVDFEYDKSSSVKINSALSQLLQQAVGKRSQSKVEASYQGNKLILKGVVATAHDRDLAGLMAHMEPGVDQVQNDLVVKTAEAPDSKE